MAAKKLIEFGNVQNYRLVRVHPGFTAVEKVEGFDWLGKKNWKCIAWQNKAFHRVTLPDGRVVDCIEQEWVEKMLNHLGDAMMREKRKKSK